MHDNDKVLCWAMRQLTSSVSLEVVHDRADLLQPLRLVLRQRLPFCALRARFRHLQPSLSKLFRRQATLRVDEEGVPRVRRVTVLAVRAAAL